MTQLSATQLLRDNHKTLRGLFRQYESLRRKAPEMKEGIVRETFMMIDIHFKLEEEFLYPLIEQAPDDPAKSISDDCEHDHASVRALIQALKARGIRNEYFDSGFESFITTCEEHFEREETELFVFAESYLGERLREYSLLQAIEHRRNALSSAPEYQDALPEVVQNPHGGEQMRKTSGERKRAG